MTPQKIKDASYCFGAPKDWDADKNGECADLFVRVEDGVCVSAWKPSPDELHALLNGGHVLLHVWGGQPPVAITVGD